MNNYDTVVSQIVKQEFEKTVLTKFNSVKNDMIDEFLNHPVTKEILNGPDSTNDSGTLGGYGNLFSYIGFYNGDDPIEPILNELKKSTIVFSRLVFNGALWNIYIPSKEDIWEVSPMPWAPGRSWAKGIETGISGVGYYLFDSSGNLPSSRSETAIQTQNKIKSKIRFKNVKYISSLLSKYELKFSQLDETAIST